jgi:hypothetical protein
MARQTIAEQNVFGKDAYGKQVAVFIPSTTDVNNVNVALGEHYTQHALRVLSDLFGGASAIPVQGAYVANDGSLVIESVTKVYSYAKRLSHTDLKSVKALAQHVCKQMSQESVLVEVNGNAHFVGKD